MLSLPHKELCCLGRRKNAMNRQKGWCISKIGWCVGCNPPSVVCGIRLIGLPAPSGRCFIGDCLPFPLAGRPFHRFHSSALDITNVSSQSPGGRFVSAPLPTLSRCPEGLQFYMWAEFPQTQTFGSDSHTPTRQPT
jgi:hypothetical protein